MSGRNDFKVFDEAGTNTLSQAEYEADAQRINGVQSGMARSNLHNKAMHQATMMAAAIGEVLSSKGMDATDQDVVALTEKIKSAFGSQLVYYSLHDLNPSFTNTTSLATIIQAMEVNSILNAQVVANSVYPATGSLTINKYAANIADCEIVSADDQRNSVQWFSHVTDSSQIQWRNYSNEINNLSGMVDVQISTRASQDSVDNVKTVIDSIKSYTNNIDTTVSSRAPANTALSSAIWTNARASLLDRIGTNLLNYNSMAGYATNITTLTKGVYVNINLPVNRRIICIGALDSSDNFLHLSPGSYDVIIAGLQINNVWAYGSVSNQPEGSSYFGRIIPYLGVSEATLLGDNCLEASPCNFVVTMQSTIRVKSVNAYATKFIIVHTNI